MNITVVEGNESMERERVKLWKERASREGRRGRSGTASKQVRKSPLLLKK